MELQDEQDPIIDRRHLLQVATSGVWVLQEEVSNLLFL